MKLKKGKKSTKFFFSREHNRGEKKQIRVLVKNNTYTHEEKEFVTEIYDFYKKLYDTEQIDEKQ